MKEKETNTKEFPHWNKIYVIVLVYTAVIIGVLAWFSSAFSLEAV